MLYFVAVEELVCLATWKEGSTRYLIGKISQGNRRSLTSDEDQYRCFIYQRALENGRTVYNIAQSGDATCNGLQNAFEGSRTMKLTTSKFFLNYNILGCVYLMLVVSILLGIDIFHPRCVLIGKVSAGS